MASTTTHTAGFAHKQQARRHLSRIVPAIPHRLARGSTAPTAAPAAKPLPAARPITPEEASKPPKPQPAQQFEPQEEDVKPVQAQPAAAIDIPATPDSGASVVVKNGVDPPALAQSPPTAKEESVADGAEVLSALQIYPVSHLGTDTINLSDGHANGYAEEVDKESPSIQTESTLAVNGSRRKLTIPAQLPPPFYPSSKPHTPAPAVENNNVPKANLHKHQLSAGAVVFKSANGSPATPATPQEFDQDAHHRTLNMSQPAPVHIPHQYADFLPAQLQHPSEAVAPWVHPPYSMAPAEQVYENGLGYQSPPFHNGLGSQPESLENHYRAGELTLATNGTMTSHSQSPSKPQFGGPQLASDYGDEHRVLQYHNGTAPHVDHVEQSSFELAAYLFTQFGNPEFADFILQIRSPDSALVSVPVHGIIVVRSPVIAEAVRRSSAPAHRSRDARRLIDVVALDPHVTRDSLEEAVKVLYGAPLLQPHNILFGLGPFSYEAGATSSSNDARRRMQQVISYIAAAKTLQIPSMQACGMEIARMLLRWDTIDQVLRYGLQASSTRKESESEDFFAATLLNYGIDFIAYTFPVDFRLDTIAPEFHDVPRLPILLESRPPTHNPRLSKIRFGDAPPENDYSPSQVDKILSVILFSLPPPLLDRLFNHRAIANQIGWTGATKLLGDVITERENRRQKVLRGQLKPGQNGTIPVALLDNMYAEERLESSPAHPSGYRLITKRSASET